MAGKRAKLVVFEGAAIALLHINSGVAKGFSFRENGWGQAISDQ